ncbi:MAG: DHH family phosphoesterase, partial [Caldilineae bacterium]
MAKRGRIQYPAPRLLNRTVDADTLRCARQHGLGELAAHVLAGRIEGILQPDFLVPIVSPALRHLDHFRGLSAIEPAAARIVTAIVSGERIAIVSDHDCDGVTGHAVVRLALEELFGVPAERIQSWIGHRLQEGYGLTDGLVQRILQSDSRPDVLITVDHGSSDESRIRILRDKGIDVIVTDHHAMPEEGPPASALACVSP